MNSDDIQRAVRAKRHDRAAGDAPSMGRVPRMPGTGLPKGARRKRRKSQGGRGSRLYRLRKRIIKTWSVLLTATVLVILGLTVWLWVVPKMKSDGDSAGQVPGAGFAMAAAASRFPRPSEAEAFATVKQGLAVRDPEKIAEFYRPGISKPQEILDFLGSLDARDGATEHFEGLGSMDANGLLIEGVLVNFKGKDKPHNRVALLTPNPTGKWQIDFDAFARTVTPPWPELLETPAEVAQVRVYAVKDSYYNGPFRDDRQWVCYGIASPDTDQVLLAYGKVGSPQVAAMDWILAKETKMSRATLEIRRVAAAEPRQFEITKVLAEDWVVGEVPIDESFK